MNFVIPDPDDKWGPTWQCHGFAPDLVAKRRSYDIEMWSPLDFLNAVDPSFLRDDRARRWHSVQFLFEAIEEGDCFSPLQVWPMSPRSYIKAQRIVHGFKHEGRHRAFVAYQLGIERVPVAVWNTR